MAQTRGRCLSVDVPGMLVLPDGVERPAAQLTICVHERMSPVAVLHRVYVDRFPVGIFVSRASRSEAWEGADPYVLFERDLSGRNRLIGYVWPGRDRAAAHLLAVPARRPSGVSVASAGTPPLPGDEAQWVRARVE